MKRNIVFALVTIAVFYFLYSHTAGNDMPFRTSTESRLTQQSTDRVTESSNFRQTTPEEIAHSIKGQGAHAVHPDIEKEQLIKDLASEKQPASVSSIAHGKTFDLEEDVVEEQSVAGRKMMPKPKEKPKYPVTSEDKSKFLIGEEPAMNGGKPEKVSDPATLEAKAELDDILKRSPSKSFDLRKTTRFHILTSFPVIIFSKSHCPYSARAKHLLLTTYNITPAPHVVELDLLTWPLKLSNDPDSETVTMGRKIQDLLAEWTGRRTVPNILVNARSIGGSDDVAQMDSDGQLVNEIKRLAMGRVREMVRNTEHED